MRLGLSSALEHKTPGEWAGKMAELGCRTVNFPVDYTSSPEVIRDYVKAAREKRLQIGEVGAWCNPIALDENQRREGLKRCKEQLALADSIGACCCVNVSGSRGSRWDGAYRDNLTEEAWKEMVKSIREILDDVRPAHTFYTIEPMPWMYPMGPREYLRLIEEVDREHFAVHMDVFNWITSPKRYFYHEEFMEECFDKLGPYIKSCHLKDVRLRQEFTLQFEETACGKGELNLVKYGKLIEARNPDMPVIIEHLGSDREYMETLAYVKELFGREGLEI